MAMPKHVFRIKNAAGTTVKRVGDDDYYAAKKLADDWVAALTRQTGQPHYREKVRNQYGANSSR